MKFRTPSYPFGLRFLKTTTVPLGDTTTAATPKYPLGLKILGTTTTLGFVAICAYMWYTAMYRDEFGPKLPFIELFAAIGAVSFVSFIVVSIWSSYCTERAYNNSVFGGNFIVNSASHKPNKDVVELVCVSDDGHLRLHKVTIHATDEVLALKAGDTVHLQWTGADVIQIVEVPWHRASLSNHG